MGGGKAGIGLHSDSIAFFDDAQIAAIDANTQAFQRKQQDA